jgi:hypothetical protein
MRKTLTLLVCAAAVLMMFATACKKDSKTPQELILGKWTFDTYSYKEVDGGVVDEDSEDVSSANYYLDFRSDGKVYAFIWGDYDTLSYSVPDAKTLIIDGDNTTLSTLTEKKFTMYYKETNTDYVYEQWMDFVK